MLKFIFFVTLKYFKLEVMIRKILAVYLLIFVIVNKNEAMAQQGVNIGSASPPHNSATLEVSGNSGGFLLPRLTTAQRNALPSPAIGLVIYNVSTACVETYFPGGWKTVQCDCSAAPPPVTQVSGPTQVCPGDTGLIFTLTPVPGATNYQWIVPASDTLISGQGDTSIVVNTGTVQGTRTYSVVASNSCGTAAVYNFQLNVQTPSAQFNMSPSPAITNLPVTFTPVQAGLNYAWIFNGGTPASSIASSPSVTWSAQGAYAVILTVQDNFGCTNADTQTVSVTNCNPQVWNFTTCGASGRNGPSQGQCDATYGAGVVTVTGGIQYWTVPATGTYRITANGAQGGNGAGRTGGFGASMRGDFQLTAGQVIKILVGQQGVNRSGSGDNAAGAGGGGSFVTLSDNTPLIVAGGGGGAGASQNGLDGTSSLNGTASGMSSGAGGINGGGGGAAMNGAAGTQSSSGGTGTSCSYGAGGGGFYTDGGMNCNGSSPIIRGIAFLNGGTGGPADTGRSGVEGGFGGGAGVGHRASGGGGWSGGGGDGSSYGGGGGGSYNAGTNQVNQSGTNSGHGSVIIQRICQ